MGGGGAVGTLPDPRGGYDLMPRSGPPQRGPAEKAAEYGFQFVDVRSRFVDHGVNAPEPWILGLTDPGLFHPNLSGYRACTAAVTSSLNGGTSAS